MKLLTCNAGYLLGYQNILGGYVPPPVASLLGNREIEQQKLAQLVSLIDRERPDVVSLLELDQGSYRTVTDGQYRTLVEALQKRNLVYRGAVANKYSETGVMTSVPFFSHLSNALLSRSERSMTTHYLSAGRKRLVIEVELTDDTVLFIVHLSLGARSRARQLDQLKSLLADRREGRKVIVTGDFNTFDGAEKLTMFAETTGLTTWIPGETVPSRPLDNLLGTSRELDLFLCSPTVDISRCDVLDVQVSDHRPVVLEVSR